MFFFTPNVLMYSRLRRLGEEVKAIKENFLTRRYVRAYEYARSARGARVRAVIGEGDGKVGRKEKESGGGVKRVGDEERKGSRSGDEGGAGREE